MNRSVRRRTTGAGVALLHLCATSSAQAADPGPLGEAEPGVMVGVGDVDGDGHGDVIHTEPGSAEAGLRGGSASGPHAAAVGLPGPACAGPPDAGPAGDVDGDGLADLWLTWPAARCDDGRRMPARGELWRGRASGEPELVEAWTDRKRIGITGIGDLGQDGRDDLLVLEGDRARWRGEGGRWEVPADAVAAAGDADGDGYADLLVVDGDLARWAPGGPAGPGEIAWEVRGMEGMGALGLGDVDGDGFDDVAVIVPATARFGGSLSLYLGGPDGPDPDAAWYVVGDEAMRISRVTAAGDVDGDGFADFATSGSTVAWWSGGPQGPVPGGDLGGTAVFALGDVDGDGLFDVAVGEGSVARAFGEAADADGDGIGRWADCDDTDAAVRGGAAEIPGDGVDQDCDGGDLCFADADGDGFGGVGTVASADRDCADPGEAALSDDCDDGHPRRGGPEQPADGRDGDCDGMERCWLDLDFDGWGQRPSASADLDCDDWGEAAAPGDCDDHDPGVFPGRGDCEEAAATEADAGCGVGGAEWALLLGAGLLRRARRLVS